MYGWARCKSTPASGKPGQPNMPGRSGRKCTQLGPGDRPADSPQTRTIVGAQGTSGRVRLAGACKGSTGVAASRIENRGHAFSMGTAARFDDVQVRAAFWVWFRRVPPFCLLSANIVPVPVDEHPVPSKNRNTRTACGNPLNMRNFQRGAGACPRGKACFCRSNANNSLFLHL